MTDGAAHAPAGDAGVGPVLEVGDAAWAVVAAIRAAHTGVVVREYGSYLRVLVPGRCVLTREAVERELGQPFRMPGDLEIIMPSFKGKLALSSDAAEWSTR